MFAKVRRKTNGLWARAEQAESERCLLSVFSDGKVTPEQVRGDIRGF